MSPYRLFAGPATATADTTPANTVAAAAGSPAATHQRAPGPIRQASALAPRTRVTHGSANGCAAPLTPGHAIPEPGSTSPATNGEHRTPRNDRPTHNTTPTQAPAQTPSPTRTLTPSRVRASTSTAAPPTRATAPAQALAPAKTPAQALAQAASPTSAPAQTPDQALNPASAPTRAAIPPTAAGPSHSTHVAVTPRRARATSTTHDT